MRDNGERALSFWAESKERADKVSPRDIEEDDKMKDIHSIQR